MKVNVVWDYGLGLVDLIGHLVCGVCIGDMSKCHTCRCRIDGTVKNFQMEHILAYITEKKNVESEKDEKIKHLKEEMNETFELYEAQLRDSDREKEAMEYIEM